MGSRAERDSVPRPEEGKRERRSWRKYRLLRSVEMRERSEMSGAPSDSIANS
jgi:hypothetical protein